MSTQSGRPPSWTTDRYRRDETLALAPDLIILDLFFGRQSAGGALAQQLKTYAATKTMPVIVCTAGNGQVETQLGD
jgi:CheY-like chemotaxis protein